MRTGGLLPFPRTGCVLVRNASVVRSIQQVKGRAPAGALPGAPKFRLVQGTKADRVRHFLKDSRISPARKFGSEAASNTVIGLASSRHIGAIGMA